jgi:hypothetical protein
VPAEIWASVQRRLLRVAAFDTGALDGLYPANPELTSRLAHPAVPEGQSAGTVTEALNAFVGHQLRGYRMAAELGEGGGTVDSDFVRRLHAQLTGPQETFLAVTPRGEEVLPLPRGEYKQILNLRDSPDGSVTPYAPVRLVPREMDRLVEQLNSPAFAQAHPAVQAAYVHHAITQIHPFSDANGRVARALGSVYFSRAAGVPLLILHEQWPSYNAAERRADDSSHQELIDFIYARGIDAMDLATSLLSPLPATLRAKLDSWEPVATPVSIVDGAAARLVFDALVTELRERLISPPASVRLGLTPSFPEDRGASAIRPVIKTIDAKSLKQVNDPETGNDGVLLALQSDRPPARRIERRFIAVVSTIAGDLMPVGILEVTTGAHLELSLQDVDPLLTDMARMRLRAWVSSLVAGLYAEMIGSVR